MKIVHVIGYFQPELGYEEFYTAREQARMGHEVAVITSDRIFPFSDEIKAALKDAGMDTTTRKRPRGKSTLDGIEVHRLPSAFEGLYDFVAVLGLKDALVKLKPDIVHAHETIQGTPAIAALHKKLGFALVVDHHGYSTSYGEQATAKNRLTQLEYKLIRRPLANSAFRRADAVVAITEETKRFLMDYHKLPAEKITVLPLAVDTDLFRFNAQGRKKLREKLELDAADVLFITTGRLDPAKKLEDFIKAFGKAKAGNKKMLIIGSGTGAYEEKLKISAGKYGGSENVVFEKFTAQTELPAYYSAADCGFWGKASITIIEGMACRLPVILPELDTINQLFAHKNAKTFKPFKIDEITNCFEFMLENPKKRALMGKNSEKVVKDEFNYRRRTEKLMKIYESCLKNN